MNGILFESHRRHHPGDHLAITSLALELGLAIRFVGAGLGLSPGTLEHYEFTRQLFPGVVKQGKLVFPGFEDPIIDSLVGQLSLDPSPHPFANNPFYLVGHRPVGETVEGMNRRIPCGRRVVLGD